jgi:hypothetical protein
MLGYGGPAHIKVIGNGVQVQGLLSNQVNDLPAGWVGYGLEYVSSGSYHNV